VIQEMSPELIGLHKGVPYSQGWSRVFITVIASSIVFSLSQAICANRQESACRSEWLRTGKFCSLASLVQFCYLALYVMATTFSRKELWECHFTLGVALIHAFDSSGVIRAA
jgi:hypothetical protein